MRNAELEEAQAGIKFAGRNNNNHFICKYNYCFKSAFYLWFVFIMKRGNASSHFNHGDRTGTLLREVSNCLRRRKPLLNAIYTHITRVIKTVGQKKKMDQWKNIEILESNLHNYEHLIFDNEGKTIQWIKGNLFNMSCWEN